MKFFVHIEIIRKLMDEFADEHNMQTPDKFVYYNDLLNALTNLEHAHTMQLERENNEHPGNRTNS